MNNIKRNFMKLCASNGLDHKVISDIVEYLDYHVRRENKEAAFEHLTYCVLFSGLTDYRDLRNKVADYE